MKNSCHEEGVPLVRSVLLLSELEVMLSSAHHLSSSSYRTPSASHVVAPTLLFNPIVALRALFCVASNPVCICLVCVCHLVVVLITCEVGVPPVSEHTVLSDHAHCSLRGCPTAAQGTPLGMLLSLHL
eukprot:gene19298-biopygen5985